MITLQDFYPLIDRNARVTLINSETGKPSYCGSVRDISPANDHCPVDNFSMDDNGHLTFKIRISATKPTGDGWVEGALVVLDSRFHYWLKPYEKRSKYGINGSRVSKLMIKRGNAVVCSYDRGWDVQPVDDETRLAMEIILHQYM